MFLCIVYIENSYTPPRHLLVERGVVLLLQLKQIVGHLVSQDEQFGVHVGLGLLVDARLVRDGLVHRGKVVQDEELLEVGDELHQRLPCLDLWEIK